MPVKGPNNTQRLTEIGRTGTGKTVAGLYWLSTFDLSSPWVVLNFKNDEHIESIEKARLIGFDYVPKKKDTGLFVIDVMPADCKGTSREKSTLEKYFESIWQRTNCGIFIDEAWMVGANDGFTMCLTQGRSRRVPMIICTQRPSWITRFAFSEASYIQVFDLNDDRDIDTVEGFVPVDWDAEEKLAPHQSYYYDIANDELAKVNPVPNMDEIRDRFDKRLAGRKIWI